MKYRLTVKGQVALATVLLLVVFAVGSLSQFSGAGPAAEEPAAPPASPASSASAEATAPIAPAENPASESTAAATPSQTASEKVTAAVYFEPDQWEIKAREIQKITVIAERMAANPALQVVVEGNINRVAGHTETEFGKDLSLKRAQVVVQVLIGKGIDETRIVVKSNGSSKPVATEPDKAWMNRRADLYIE